VKKVELFTKSQVRFLTLTLTRSAKIEKTAIQSFSNAVHPLWRSYDQKVAHIFRAEDDDREPRSPLIVP